MAWTNVKGFNFRATSGFVTDGTNQTFDLGAAYPRSVTIDSDTFSVGWPVDATARARDRAVQDPRLSGIISNANSAGEVKWRIDLPSAGQYTIRLAMGDQAGSNTVFFRIYDNSTVLATVSNVATVANGFVDATGVARTSPTDWINNNASVTLNFATTICFIGCGDPSTIAGSFSSIAHFDIVQAGGGGGTSAKSLLTLGIG